MLKSLSTLVLLIGLSGCATMPDFQKEAKGEGYSIRNLESPKHFEVALKLPGVSSDRFIGNYAFRAVGETCLERGFEYFSPAKKTAELWEGFCYKTQSINGLNISFDRNESTASAVIVSDLNKKESSNFKLGDRVVKANGSAVTSLADIKFAVFSTADKAPKSLPFEIVRDGKTMTINEPLVQTLNAVAGPNDLTQVRFDVK